MVLLALFACSHDPVLEPIDLTTTWSSDQTLDADVTVRRLDIFVKGDLCVAHLDRPDLRPAPAPLSERDATTTATEQ